MGARILRTSIMTRRMFELRIREKPWKCSPTLSPESCPKEKTSLGMWVNSCACHRSREFQSLVQTIVLSLRLNEFGCISTRLESTLDLLDSVTRNDATEGILTLLDIVCYTVFI